MMAGAALAADPGIDLPNDPSLRLNSQVSDQKKGSVLIYNLYSSGSTGGSTNNTRVNITNTNANFAIFVHLFFVDGNSCGVADSYICLTANQTASFLTSDIDPGVAGYILAIATNDDGLPVTFDWLIGDAYVKLDSGHAANLGAEAVSVSVLPLLFTSFSGGSIAGLQFDGCCYNRLPRVLGVDNIPARADGNDTLLVINRIGGNYAIGAGTVGLLFGLLFDDAENVFSFSQNANVCQLRATISNNFPRTTPRVENVIPAGRSGWMKIWTTSTVDQSGFVNLCGNGPNGTANDPRAITGAVLNRNANAGAQANAFNGGHNLHHLTLNPMTVIFIPIFPPSC
jgi:hypothetical protein